MSSDCGWRGDRVRAARRGVNAESATRLYGNAELGVRFEIDSSFLDDPHRDPAPGLPGNVLSASLTANGPDGRQAMLSISRVEAGYETSPQELAEQLIIHNRFAADTAERHGWTIHSPWKAAMLAGYPAMHCDYVVPGAVREAASGTVREAASGAASEAASSGAVGPPAAAHQGSEPPPAALGGEASSPGHVQAWVVYAGPWTFQVTLGVNPPGDLARNRATLGTVVRSFEITAPGSHEAGAGQA